MENQRLPLDPSVLPYLRQADNTFREGFEDSEMRGIFFDRVFEEINGYESKLSLMKSSCFIMEQFIAEANAKQMLQVLQAFKANFEELSRSQQGCHVFQVALQTTVRLCEQDGFTDELVETLISLSKSLKKQSVFVSWMTDRYATHITRSLFETVGGFVFASTKSTTNDSKKTSVKQQQDVIIKKDRIPKSLLQRLIKWAGVICKLDRKTIAEILTDSSGCPCMCAFLRVVSLRLPKTLRRTCNKIIEICGGATDSTLLLLGKDKTGSRFIEALFEYGDSETCEKLFQTFASENDKLIELACHPVANFVIQKLISSPRLSDKFTEIFDALLPGLEDMFAENRFGVVQKLAEQCLRLGCRQKKLLDALLETFHCKEEDRQLYIVPLVASFTTYNTFVPNDPPQEPPELKEVVYHGSLLLQTLFQFKKTMLLSKSLTTMPGQHSVSLASGMAGSHVIDTFLSSPTVKDKFKNMWFKKMKVHFHQVSCDKYGSRVIDNIWKAADLKLKILIAESLVEHSERLLKDQFGKHVYRNLGLRQFAERQSDWEDFQQRQLKKRKMFDEILPESERLDAWKKKKA